MICAPEKRRQDAPISGQCSVAASQNSAKGEWNTLVNFVFASRSTPTPDRQSKKAVIVSNDRYKEAREGGNLKGSDLLRAGGKSPKGEFRQRWNKEKA